MMPLVITVRLDLSPAFEAAIAAVLAAVARAEPAATPDSAPAASAQPEPPRPEPPGRAPRPEPAAAASEPAEQAAPTQAQAADGPTAPDRPSPRQKPWTAERNAVLCRDYPAGRARAAITDAVNALPGPPLTAERISVQAVNLGLTRPSKPPIVPVPPAMPEQQPAGGDGGEIIADDATIRHWAAARGLCNGGEALDLDRINAKRESLGLPRYARRNGLRQSGALMRPGNGAAA